MELYKLPIVKRWLATADSRQKQADAFQRLTHRDSHKAAALMQSFATAINSLNGKLGVLDSTSPTFADDTNDLTALRDGILDLSRRCYYSLRGSSNRLPRIVYLVKVSRLLGVSRNLGKLRDVIEDARIGMDFEQSMLWLRQQVDITYCDHCEEYEYTVKFKSAFDGGMDDIHICRYCAENSFYWSDYYDRYIHQDDYRNARHADGSMVICHSEDDDFTYDDNRDAWYHVDYTPPPPPVIGNYHSSKPYQRLITDEWSRLKHRWFGVELEVEIKDHAIDRNDKAKQLHELLNNGETGKRVFFESDGSLSNGFEIVTQPMSLPMHSELWQWLRDRDATRHLLSHNTRTCGLHVHVNKDNLTQIQIAKIVTFVNDPRNESMIRAIARRYAEGYCKIKEKKLESAHQSSDRYEAINITPRHTIEFRIFKGSLKYESVIAAVEFCNALCEFSALSSTNDVNSLSGDNFIDFINNDGAAETQILRPYMNAVLQTA